MNQRKLLLLAMVAGLLLAACARRGSPPPGVTATATNAASNAPTALAAAATSAPASPTRPRPPTLTPAPTPTLQPDARLAAAREAERLGDWDAAFALYESLREDPAHGTAALFALGELYARDDRLLEAAAALQTALQREPDGPLAPAIRYRLGRGWAAVGQHARAVELWQEFDAASDEADDLVAARLAESFVALGDDEAALAQWERVYNTPEAGRVTRALTARRLADWHAGEAQWADARGWYEQALSLSQVPEYRAELLGALARVATEMEDEQVARRHWRTLIQEHPDTPQALAAAEGLAEAGEPLSDFARGELLLANEKWVEAARAFFASLETERDRAEAHQGAAQALEGAGRHEAARAEWQKLLDTHPEAAVLHDDALLGVGRAEAALGEDAAAMATWARVAAEFPDGDAAPAALWERAVWLRDNGGDPATAAAAFEALATRYPDDPGAIEALWQAGLLRFRARDGEDTQQTFLALAERDGEQPERALFWAGKAAALAGDAAAARAHWARAAEVGGYRYYGLRAADTLAERRWVARASRTFAIPDEGDLSWLREAANLPPDADLLALPDEPLLARGRALLLMGERGAAMDAFLAAVRAHRDEPQPLWAMAHEFRRLELPSYSLLAATRLMEQLGYTPLDAPPALAALAYPLPFEAPLRAAAAEWGYDPLLFAALVYQESRWEPRARSDAAARGLTQVIPDTGRWIAQRLGDARYRYSDLDRPLVSFRYGSYYLDYVLDRFDDNPFHALAAYNGGPGNAQRWLAPDDDLFVETISLGETRRYVEEVYRHWHAYQRLYRPSTP